MKRRKIALTAILVSCLLMIAAGASAAWDSGTADNDDGGSSTDSGSDWDSDTSDNDDDGSSSSSTTDDSDSSWDSGTADNDDGQTEDTNDGDSGTESDNTTENETWDNQTADNNDNTWDNETADNDDGGNSTNNDEWDNQTADNNDDTWDNETATNDSGWDNQTADNNDNQTSQEKSDGTTSEEDETSQEQDGNNNDTVDDGGGQDNGGQDGDGTNDNEDDAAGDQDQTEDSSESVNGGGIIDDIIDVITPESLTLNLENQKIQIGQSTTVSGKLEGEDPSGKTVEILIDGRTVGRTRTDQNGEYSHIITPETVGTKRIKVKTENKEKEASLRVTPTVTINFISTSSNIREGEEISVCPQIISQVRATATLYQNGERIGSKTGNGNICFQTYLDKGENRFRVRAEVEDDSDTKEITRTTRLDLPNIERETSTPTGGFFQTTGLWTSGIILLAIIIGAIFYRNRINPLNFLRN